MVVIEEIEVDEADVSHDLLQDLLRNLRVSTGNDREQILDLLEEIFDDDDEDLDAEEDEYDEEEYEDDADDEDDDESVIEEFDNDAEYESDYMNDDGNISLPLDGEPAQGTFSTFTNDYRNGEGTVPAQFTSEQIDEIVRRLKAAKPGDNAQDCKRF